jgi:hypothetical protein
MANGEQPSPLVAPPPPTGSATVFNTFPAASPFTFGSTDETGIAVDSYDQNDQVDEFQQRNAVGNIIEIITHNPRSDLTVSGEISTTMSPILGTVWTPTNLILQQYGGTATGIVIVKGMAYSKGRAKNMSMRISATYYPFVTL